MAGTRNRSGRKPTPTALKLLRGNPGRRPLNENEPKPKAALPKPPDHLSPVAKQEWRRAGRLLQSMGLISDLDLAAFALYCTAWARWVEAEQALSTYGVMLKSPQGFPIQSPYLSVANRAMDQIRSLLSEFGMSPATRTRVSAMVPDDDDDPMERLLRQMESRTPGART
jgi:P27 family predicted phage terminase small subunit